MRIDVTARLRPYLALAVRDLCRQLQRDGSPVPAELAALLDELWPEKRHSDSAPDDRPKALASARTRRWRARQRGEAVPLRQAGRPKKRHGIAS